MAHEQFQSFIDACIRCAQECEHWCQRLPERAGREVDGGVYSPRRGLRGDLLGDGFLREPRVAVRA